MEYIVYTGYLIKIILALIVVFGCINYKCLNTIIKVVFNYSIGAFLIEMIAWGLVWFKQSNSYMIHIILVFQLLIFSRYFFKLNEDSCFLKKMINILTFTIVLLLMLIYSFKIEYIKNINPIYFLIMVLPLIVYSLISIAKSLTNQRISEYSLVNFGIFSYITASSLVFLSRDFLLEKGFTTQEFVYVYIFNNVMYIVLLIFIFNTIWKQVKLVQEKS